MKSLQTVFGSSSSKVILTILSRFPLIEVTKERKPRKRKHENSAADNSRSSAFVSKEKKTSNFPTKEELKKQIEKQRDKIKILNQKIRRETEKVVSLKNVI